MRATDVEVNEVRILIMVASVAIFLGIVWWAYAPKRSARMRRAGEYILDDEDTTLRGEKR